MAGNSTAANATALSNADWNDVLSNLDPFFLAGLGTAFALAFCVIGAGWSVDGRARAIAAAAGGCACRFPLVAGVFS